MIYIYESTNNCLLISASYDYLVMVGVVYVEEVLFASLALTIRDYPYFPSWSTWYLNLEYMISGFEDPVALHCIAPHFMAFGVMLRTYDCDRTGTTSFIGHNDAASYLVGYEGRSSYASMCIKHHWFGIILQLHALMVWIHEFQCIDLLFFKKWLIVGCGVIFVNTYAMLLC